MRARRPCRRTCCSALNREGTSRAKILSNSIKQKRAEKAGKWSVPIPKVRAVADDEMFRVQASGKRKKKAWKRVVTKITFVDPNFTRKPPKYERFIRPSGLRMKKAHVTHPELKATFCLDILGVKKNPSSAMSSRRAATSPTRRRRGRDADSVRASRGGAATGTRKVCGR